MERVGLLTKGDGRVGTGKLCGCGLSRTFAMYVPGLGLFRRRMRIIRMGLKYSRTDSIKKGIQTQSPLSLLAMPRGSDSLCDCQRVLGILSSDHCFDRFAVRPLSKPFFVRRILGH